MSPFARFRTNAVAWCNAGPLEAEFMKAHLVTLYVCRDTKARQDRQARGVCTFFSFHLHLSCFFVCATQWAMPVFCFVFSAFA